MFFTLSKVLVGLTQTIVNYTFFNSESFVTFHELFQYKYFQFQYLNLKLVAYKKQEIVNL